MAPFGRALLSQPTRIAFEAERDSIPDSWPGLPGMAQQVDAHWSARIEAFSTDVYGLRGMHVIMYRPLSALVHGMSESLTRVVGDGPERGVSRVGVAIVGGGQRASQPCDRRFKRRLIEGGANGAANGRLLTLDVIEGMARRSAKIY